MSEENNFLDQSSAIELKQLLSVLENTLNNLNLARNVALKETVHLDYMTREVIENDYKTAIRLFEELTQEVTNQHSFSALNSFIEERHETKEELNRAEKKAEETKENLNIIKSEIANETISNYQEAQALNIELGTLKDQYQDELWEHEVKSRYATEWLHAQNDQHKTHLQQNERGLEEQVEQIEENLELEHRVHDELEDFYSMKLGEYIQQLVHWVDKYEQDKNDYDEKIAKIKSEHAQLLERTTAAKELYASRQAEIAAYEAFKEKRRLEELHMAHLNANATRIQAWWKGMMVRCKLGPYKVKKSKGKGKGKKK